MNLPLTTRHSEKGIFLPGKEGLMKCFELASTPEAAQYFAIQLKRKLIQTKTLSKFQNILHQVEKYARSVTFVSQQTGDAWSGHYQKNTKFDKEQRANGQIALKDILKQSKGAIRFDFALGNKGEIKRMYTQNGKSVSKELTESLDVLLNASLATFSKRMVSEKGVIYEADENGNIKKDKAGNPVKASTTDAREALLGNLKGRFEGKSVSLNCIEHPFVETKAAPEKAPEEKRAPVVPAAATASQEKQAPPAPPEEAPDTTTPQTPGG